MDNTKKKLERVLVKVKQSFDKHKIPFWLIGGVVLGLVREKGFIENDFDIDLGISSEDVARAIRCCKNELGVVEVREKDGVVRCIKTQREGIKIDVLIFRRKKEMRYIVAHCENIGYVYHVYPSKLFRELEEIIFLGQKFKVLSPVEEYLECEYGADWRTPKEYWNCCVDSPSVRSKI